MAFHFPHWIHRSLRLPYLLHYKIEGSGPPIVMLHGLAGSSENWRQLVPLLSKDYTCITIDLLGFGYSPKPQWPAYTPQQHISSIRHTLLNIGVRDFVLIGHSLGSLLAAGYSARHPRQIKQLYLLSPPIYKGVIESRRGRQKWTETMYDGIYKYLRSHKRFTMTGARYAKRTLLRGEGFILTERTWIPFINSLEQCIQNQDSMRDIARIKAPVDIFYGGRDQLISIRNIKRLSKHHSITIHPLRGGHGVTTSYAKRVASIIKSNAA